MMLPFVNRFTLPQKIGSALGTIVLKRKRFGESDELDRLQEVGFSEVSRRFVSRDAADLVDDRCDRGKFWLRD